jgi:hypothetical protein
MSEVGAMDKDGTCSSEDERGALAGQRRSALAGQRRGALMMRG